MSENKIASGEFGLIRANTNKFTKTSKNTMNVKESKIKFSVKLIIKLLDIQSSTTFLVYVKQMSVLLCWDKIKSSLCYI